MTIKNEKEFKRIDKNLVVYEKNSKDHESKTFTNEANGTFNYQQIKDLKKMKEKW